MEGLNPEANQVSSHSLVGITGGVQTEALGNTELPRVGRASLGRGWSEEARSTSMSLE